MNYTKTSLTGLQVLVSKINLILLKDKNIVIPDLVKLENFFNHPKNKKIHGSLTLTFSSVKSLKNGAVLKLNEIINFKSNTLIIKSIWYENYFGNCFSITDSRLKSNDSGQFVFYSISYSLNAIRNILHVNKGNFNVLNNNFQVINMG